MPEEVALPYAQTGEELVLRHLEYESMPWQTHPIDIAHGSQGWGPFPGPWSPCDFESAKDVMTGGFGLDITYDAGDNRTDYAPPYSVYTIMQDKSLDLVNNTNMLAMVYQGNDRNGGSTFAQADSVQVSGVGQGRAGASGFWSSLRAMFTGEPATTVVEG